MREIKFRGRNKNGNWVRGNLAYIHGIGNEGEWTTGIQMHSGQGYRPWGTSSVNPETVGQFCGLRDKNGVEVYDGDIYRNLDSGLIGKLRIVDGVGGLYVLCTEYKNGLMYNNRPFAELDTTNFEVIGNIYENPELIGGAPNE